MEFITFIPNRSRLQEINEEALESATLVEAAVAYVENERHPLLVGCWNASPKIPLRLWGRYDSSALATALANPGIVPRSVDLKNLGDRATTLKNLGELKRSLGQLLEKVSDTETQLASDLYAVTRSVYAVMKTPVTVPGLNVQKDRLAKRFYRKARRQSEDTAAKTAA